MELLVVIYGLESVIDNITSQKIKLDEINFYTTSNKEKGRKKIERIIELC